MTAAEKAVDVQVAVAEREAPFKVEVAPVTEAQSASAPQPAAPARSSAPGAILFNTPTCPNCKAAAALLQKAGIEYLALNANEEKELVEKYGVKQAPTLVLLDGDKVEKYRGVSDIKGWLMKQR